MVSEESPYRTYSNGFSSGFERHRRGTHSTIQRFNRDGREIAKRSWQTPQYFPGSKDEIVSELVQRREQLRADTEQQVKQIEDAGEADKAKLKEWKKARLGSQYTDEEDHAVTAEENDKFEKIVSRVNYQVFTVREKCRRDIENPQASGSALKTQQKRLKDDDAAFMTKRTGNLYSRSYETYGDPSGNPIPVIAEPKQMQLKAAPSGTH